jgi:hypothetical protein
MMSAKELRKKFEVDLKELQESCQHPSSTWCEEYWAIAHSTGRQVRVCDFCEKILETK